MRNAVTTSFLGLTAIGLLAGCPDRTISEVNPQQGRVEYKDIPVSVNRDIDILFIIDDSGSMADKQTNLKNNFPNFINVLNTIDGGLPNVHLGVVSSDVGALAADGSAAQNVGGCSASGGKNGNLLTKAGGVVSGAFISDVKAMDGTRTKNYSGSLADAFSEIASLGINGCGFEQHFEAAKRALNTNPANAGFLRKDAYLALVFIQDEDDCSVAKSTLFGADTSSLGPLQSFRCNRFGHVCAQGGQDSNAMNTVGTKGECSSNESGQYLTKVSDYVAFFKGLKTDPSSVIVAGIAGPTTPYEVELRRPPNMPTAMEIQHVGRSCTYTGTTGAIEVADPSVRLKQFLDSFPNRSTFSTICQQDLSGALVQIAQLLKTVLGSPCIDGKLADVDLETAGNQYDCSVSDVTNYGKANQSETVLPQCSNTQTPGSSNNIPCWSIQVDPMCGGPGMLTLKIERGGQTPANDTHVVSYCVTES